MPIKLQCVCRKNLELPDHLAGEKIRCKHCGKVMTVPRKLSDSGPARAIDPKDPLKVKGSRQCSGCGKMYPPSDKVCTACGLDLDTGAMLYASLENPAPGAAPGEMPEPEVGFVGRLLRRLGLRK